MVTYYCADTAKLVKLAAALREAGSEVFVVIVAQCDEATRGASYLTTDASRHTITDAARRC